MLFKRHSVLEYAETVYPKLVGNYTIVTKVSHPLKHWLSSFTFACRLSYSLTFNTCLTGSYVVCPYTSSHFFNASVITRILFISLSFPLIVAIRCWGVIPSTSPKMRRMRSIQARTRLHKVSAMRLPSMPEKSSPMVWYSVNRFSKAMTVYVR